MMSRFRTPQLITNSLRSVSTRSRSGYRRVVLFIKRWPLTSFFVILLLLLALIIASNMLAPKPETPVKPEIIKSVQVYQLGVSPKVSAQAKIEKSGVIKITALAPGVIQKINFREGAQINKGAVLVNMSSNYQGGNAASVQRQLAAKQYQNSKDTLADQKEVIRISREIANKSETSAADMRDIANRSLQETRDLIDFNQSLLNTLADNQTNLERNNPNGINDATILQIRGQRAQLQGGINQLRQGLRQAEYQAAGDKAPADLARLQKEMTLKTLDNQQKALDLGLEVSRLQLVLAQINEATLFPVAPFNAVVQRVHVKEGEAVNPGTPLMTISAVDDPLTAVVNLPHNLAGAVSTIEPSTLWFDNQSIDLKPTFISTEATDGTLYSVFYTIPDQYLKTITDGEHIAVELPVGITNTESEIPFIPLDSIYQTPSESIVLVVQNDQAVSKPVVLGEIFGRFVEVQSGLAPTDQIILNRNIVAGDKIRISQ